MHVDVYEQLADALDALPNGYPRTPSKVEIKILKKIFSFEEAKIASQLTGRMEPVNTIAERTGLEVSEARGKLMAMVKRGLVWFSKKGGKPYFRLAPFIVGIFEAQVKTMDAEFARLFEQYFMASGGAAGIADLQPAILRVVPAHGTVKTEWIMPYDDIKAMLQQAKVFHVDDCICRKQQDLIDERKCDFPIHNCMTFFSKERPAREGDITKEEALTLLRESEEVGLVHTVSNMAEGVFFVCNCCGCCCAGLRAINELGIADSVAAANYYAVIDQDKCTACGICVERCQVNAVAEQDGEYSIIRDKCIGCGLCVTGCPSDAAELILKPESEIIHPPQDYSAWESERLRNRGTSERSSNT